MSHSPIAPPDYWRVLGIEPGADAATLKRAFRTQARRWHPDLNGNDPVAEDQFKLVNEAYAVLSDPLRRRAWERGETQAEQGPADPFATGFPSFEDYLAELFGERPGRGDVAEAAEAPAEEDWPGPPPAEPAGSVTPSPAPPPPVQASSDDESLVDLSPEQALQGERVELELADGTCVEVWTPPLAGDGWRLRLAGVTPGGGDHFLHLRVRTAEGLRIDGLRVLYPLELTPAEAALGCRVVVPTLRGPVKLTVPQGSSSGRLLRLRGRGMEWGSQRGDQLVEVRIVVPDQLDDAEIALYRRLQELAELASREASQEAAGA
ncbi:MULTISPECIES: DnaJ C-terminal domain-containing protein [Aphanothece]|uniref:DnaJ C-terminal domain-containing protein n=1 Tax=Aphanothece TaxID=1121 RepID=UPI003984F6CE